MKVIYYDKRIRMLFISLTINILLIVAALAIPKSCFIGTQLNLPVICFMATAFIVLGNFDLIRNRNRIKNNFALAILRLLMALTLLCGSLNSILLAFYAWSMDIIFGWILLFFSSNFLFGGCYAPVRKYSDITAVAVAIIIDFFIISIYDSIFFIITEILHTIPMILLIVLCRYYLKQKCARSQKNLYIAYIIASGIAIITNCAVMFLYQLGILNFHFTMPSLHSALIFMMFSILFDITLNQNKTSYVRVIIYTISLLSGSLLFGICLWLSCESPKTIFIGVILSVNGIVFFEIIESLFHYGNKALEHKNAIASCLREMDEKKKIATFLHDEVLQSLYAAKMLLDISNIDNMNTKVKEILESLQNKIRVEMGYYSIEFEKHLSYKENLEAMLFSIGRKFPDRNVSINFSCSDRLVLRPPLDSMVYTYARELVTNVYKHSDGELCKISLKYDNEKICLEVSDNGNIIKKREEELFKDGFGLMSIKQQVLALKGCFNLYVNNMGGMTVKIEISERINRNELNNI